MYKYKKYVFLFMILALFLFAIIPHDSIENTSAAENKCLNILTSNKMQYYMVKEIVGDKHYIGYLFDSEESAEELEYNSSLINNDIDLYIYSSSYYEEQNKQVIKKMNYFRTGMIDISRGIRMKNYDLSSEGINPYYWTGDEEYKICLYNIKNAIEDKDPKNREYYESRYNKAISNIKNDMIDEINDLKKNYTFIAVDDYFDYLYESIGLECIKCKCEEVDKFITDNNLSTDDVIILRDASTEIAPDNYEVVTLQKYNGGLTVQELYDNNIRNIYNKLKK
ncbi:zinc ABC transporter substrate-binding protein [Clostridium sp. MSJ-8]|uniref:metal ABC transporter substrate-binding protein n=1 Tax=Clostridium sp. MSJ-8 TaxID=2841510 RepID=UPI001C0EF087|nr:zinc ABC transporter substrate-binding protein [Clostridium sp. MSJ-8]